MSTRISSAILLLPLAACGGERTADTNVLATAEANQRSAAADAGRILCARGTAPLARDCTVEQTRRTDGLILTVRHPDAGFHRLLVTTDGRGVVAADGAEIAKVSIVEGEGVEGEGVEGEGVEGEGIDVALGGDRYRLPATVKGAKPAS